MSRMSMSEKMALAARLHILLLHKTGRVTDTEWMIRNREYAEEIIRYSTEYASKENHDDLAELAEKLEAAMFSTHPAYEKTMGSHYPIGSKPARYIGGIR